MGIIDNNGKEYKYDLSDNLLILRKNEISDGIKYIDIKFDLFNAKVGDEGYYVISDYDGKGSLLCKFNNKPNEENEFKQNLMPIFGIKKEDCVLLAVVEGFRFEFSIVYGKNSDEYYIYPRFYLNGFKPYEDISIRFFKLDNSADYSDMANTYRNYKIMRGDCIPLKERIKERKELKYAMESPEIRIRLGWKKAPPEIMEQTEANEPEMKVACTFERVFDIIDELKRQKVEKAQICLVGWNKSGHDGRYPDIFPVEEKLGGERKLRDLITYAQKNGYQIVCHTNSTDCYSISKRFADDIVVKKSDNSLSISSSHWSGGRMYYLCPIKAVEYAKEDLPKVRELGFKGLHYIDVISVNPLRNCYDINHPCDSKQTLENYDSIMQMSHNMFGGFASEGVFDFTAKYLDYGLYVNWGEPDKYFGDEFIPLWECVYHGIILYNPSTETVNYPIKDKINEIRLYERGGRPAFYFYCRHLNESDIDDWLGREDLICDTDEQLVYSVSKIKEAYDMYNKYNFLQTEFIMHHEKVEENIYRITYSDGTIVCADYNNCSFSICNE